MPIGELWALGELSSYCKKTDLYSFMLPLAPRNHIGLVASQLKTMIIF